MSHPEVDRVNAANVIAAVEALNRSIAVAVEHGLTVDLTVLDLHKFGRTKPTPVVDAVIGRALAQTGLRQ